MNHNYLGCNQTNRERRRKWKGGQDPRNAFSLLFHVECHSQQPIAKSFLDISEEEYLGKAPKDCFILMPRQPGAEGTSLATCRPCAVFVFLPKAFSNYVCYKCKLISLLEVRGKDLRTALCATVS